LAQTSVITFKMQTRAVNAHLKMTVATHL